MYADIEVVSRMASQRDSMKEDQQRIRRSRDLVAESMQMLGQQTNVIDRISKILIGSDYRMTRVARLVAATKESVE